MNWDLVIEGAQVGAGIGALAGLVPLAVGYFCREKKIAVGGFLGCTLAGAIGGKFAAIAVMAGMIGQFLQPNRQPEKRTARSSWLGTLAEKFWALVGFCWLLFCMCGAMFVSAAFLVPIVLGVPNDAPRDDVASIVEPIVIFGGMGAGAVLGLVGVSFIYSRFIPMATRASWLNDFDASAMSRWALMRRLAGCFFGFPDQEGQSRRKN